MTVPGRNKPLKNNKNLLPRPLKKKSKKAVHHIVKTGATLVEETARALLTCLFPYLQLCLPLLPQVLRLSEKNVLKSMLLGIIEQHVPRVYDTGLMNQLHALT